jgi:hypothetical protein
MQLTKDTSIGKDLQDEHEHGYKMQEVSNELKNIHL